MSKQFIFDAFDNKETTRVPVGFWFHFAPEQLFVNDPDVRRKNIEGHQKYFDEFHPDFVKLMSDGYFHYPNPTLETITSVEDLKKAKSGLVDEWIDAQVTVLGFALEDSGSQLTLAQLVKEAPQELAHQGGLSP